MAAVEVVADEGAEGAGGSSWPWSRRPLKKSEEWAARRSDARRRSPVSARCRANSDSSSGCGLDDFFVSKPEPILNESSCESSPAVQAMSSSSAQSAHSWAGWWKRVPGGQAKRKWRTPPPGTRTHVWNARQAETVSA